MTGNWLAVGFGSALVLLITPNPALPLGITYYVDTAIGDDTRTPAMAQDATTPWKTITKGVFHAEGGDTIVVASGTYGETVESKRDGWSVTLPIVVKSMMPGGALVKPPAGSNGFVITHSYVTVDGFTVKRAVQGIKIGPHDGGGPAVGVLVQNNRVAGNSNNGINVSSGAGNTIAFNTVKKNGANGIGYSGDSSLIHDNVVHHNAQFGIYVKDGVGHQVYDNIAYSNGTGDDDNIKILGSTTLPPPQTYYVDCVNGDDARSPTAAKEPASPWKTIGRAVLHAPAGSTILVGSGTCNETIESQRDGTAADPIVLKSMVPGGATVQPPPGANGFVIGHDHHTIDGFTVTGAFQGIRIGPHDSGGGPVTGVLVQNNRVKGNSNNGIGVPNGVDTEIAFNLVKTNGANGISYSGDSSLIHDNVVHHNAQFGIYVKDGVNHQVYDNTVYSNGTSPEHDLKILGATLPTPVATYHVDCENGDDGYTVTQAKSPATPWRTIKNALNTADAGDTVLVLPGVCAEGDIESRRDGAPGAPITIRAASAGSVVVKPPSGNGLLIVHDYQKLVGLTVKAATVNGIQVGPHDVGGGPVTGVVVANCHVHHNAVTGVKFSRAVNSVLRNSVVDHNGSHGVSYAGSGATIFNNLVYSNGCAGVGCGDYGISILAAGGFGNDGHRVISNTIYGNLSGGLRLSDDGASSVFGAALNNIIVANPVGIKEQGGGHVTLDYNDVFANAQANYQLSGSAIGPHSISLYPEFVNPTMNDFRLGRLAAGQPADSPCIDAGSDAADALGLANWTVFTDGALDVGTVDLGRHWPSEDPAP